MANIVDLGKEIKAQYPGSYDDMSDVELGRRAKAKEPSKYSNYKGVATGVGKVALDALPAVGGALGGLAGGAGGTVLGLGVGGVPGALGGAALGGAGGEAARQLVSRALGLEAPETSGAAAGQIGVQGATQAAMEGGGQLLGATAKAVGKPLMGAALKATPDVVKTALEEGVTATSKGLQRLMDRIGKSGANTMHYVQQATRMGQRYDMVPHLQQVVADVMPQVTPNLTPKGLEGLHSAIRDFIGMNPTRSITATRMQILKQRADDLAKPIYDRIARGDPVTVLESAEAKFYKSFADHARETLRATIPDYEKENLRQTALIKLKDTIFPQANKDITTAARVIGAAQRPALGAAAGATLGAASPGNRGHNAMLGAALGGLAGTPQALSTAAVGLQNPALTQILTQLLRGGGVLAQQQ
jgi:hypothetical protein